MQINCTPTAAPSCQPRLRHVWAEYLQPMPTSPLVTLSSRLRGAEFAVDGEGTHHQKDYEDTKRNAGSAHPHCYTHLQTHRVDVREVLGRRVGKGVQMQCPDR